MSANGRHRRPRQAPALIVAAGVTGSALAIPLFAASGASAADASTWDSVAECESGGMWSADLGNGYYGGLQISQIVWDQYGGDNYAARPDLASRSQQIAIAEKVLDAQGPSVWASCAPVAGLTNDGNAPAVDPGEVPSNGSPSTNPSEAPSATDVPDPGPSGEGSDSGSTGGKTGGTHDGSADTSAAPSPSASSTSPSAGGSTASESPDPARSDDGPVAGKHRGGGDPDGAERGDDPTRPHESGRHASRSDGPAARGGDVAGDRGEKDSTHGTYEVRSGDNLWSIADAHHISGGWTSVYEANKDTVGSDPDLILPGQRLDLTAQ